MLWFEWGVVEDDFRLGEWQPASRQKMAKNGKNPALCRSWFLSASSSAEPTPSHLAP